MSSKHDPGTIRHLERLGVDTGWRCLEVGAGGGSIALWLSNRVGPSGAVVATDIDIRFLRSLHRPNLLIRRHDIVAEEIEREFYDLVHARLVLMHLAQRDTVLNRMVAALKPGGWLLIEEGDLITEVPDPRAGPDAIALFGKVKAAMDEMRSGVGDDRYYGRRLYGDLCARGLADVGAEGRTSVIQGGSERAQFRRLTPLQHRERLLATGRVTADELDAYLALLDEPDFVWMESLLVAAWGRQPAL